MATITFTRYNMKMEPPPGMTKEEGHKATLTIQIRGDKSYEMYLDDEIFDSMKISMGKEELERTGSLKRSKFASSNQCHDGRRGSAGRNI